MISLIKREVVPAIGCTEPIAVALCAAKSAELLGCEPQHITVLLDASVLAQVRDEILGLDINNLTPMQALNTLSNIRTILTGK